MRYNAGTESTNGATAVPCMIHGLEGKTRKVSTAQAHKQESGNQDARCKKYRVRIAPGGRQRIDRKPKKGYGSGGVLEVSSLF